MQDVSLVFMKQEHHMKSIHIYPHTGVEDDEHVYRENKFIDPKINSNF